MTLFQDEIQRVQNPAFGAILVHSLATGYYAAHPEHASIPLPYLFVGLPCLLSPVMLDVIKHTNSGLRAVVDKLNSSEKAGSDFVLSVSARARQLRPLTMQSVSVLIASGLATIDLQSGGLTPMREKTVDSRPERPQESDAARKLGVWLAALSPFEVSSLLKVSSAIVHSQDYFVATKVGSRS